MKFGIIDVHSMTNDRQGRSAMHHFSRRDALRGLGLLAAIGALGATPQSFAAEEVPLAIKGYDPVAYLPTGSRYVGGPSSNTNGMSTFGAFQVQRIGSSSKLTRCAMRHNSEISAR
jgi:hypothetical protein